MKIVIAGAGAYAFAPALLDDLFVKTRTNCELWLVEGDLNNAELTARAAQAVSKSMGLATPIFYTSSLYQALPGADYVIFCQDFIDPKRWMDDQKKLDEIGLGKQMRTMGGIGGAVHALKCISLVMDTAERMQEVCPNATLILTTGPMARMAEAAQRFGGIRTLGLSSAPWQAKRRIATELEIRPEDIKVLECAGLPDFSFITRMENAQGQDLIGKAVKAYEKNDFAKLFVDLYDWYGALPADDQAWEFMKDLIESPRLEQPPFYGVGWGDYNVRLSQLATIAVHGILRKEGLEAWQAMQQSAGVIRPMELVHTLCGMKESLNVPALCAPNSGAVEAVTDGRFVLTRALVSKEGIHQEHASLPLELEEQLDRVSAANILYARAGAEGDRLALREALEEDPSTDGIDLLYALDVVDEMLESDKDALPRFF